MAANSAVTNPDLSIGWYRNSERFRVALLGLGAVGVSVIGSALVLRLDFVAIAVFLVFGALVAIAAQPRVGLYALFCLILLFENVSADPLMRPGYYLSRQVDHLFSSDTGGGDSGGALINTFEVLLT